MSAPDSQPQKVPQILSVHVTKMPEAPSKPLLKDSSRLLSLAAFIFSVTTGLFATYQTWKNDRDSTIEHISNLVDQYYDGQEKLAKLNPGTQIGYINLLKSQLRSLAARMVPRALRVEEEIDDGTWQALAQINNAENNHDVAELAWLASIKNTKDISMYTFGLRGLSFTQLQLNRRDDAEVSVKLALDAAMSNSVNGTNIVNSMLPPLRATDAAQSHIFWLSEFQNTECSLFSPHFDSASALISDASRNGPANNMGYQNNISIMRAYLDGLRKIRASCAPSSENIDQMDNICHIMSNILDTASSGFSIYKGIADSEGQEFQSRVDLPESESCVIDTFSSFYCTWPENDEAGTKMRSDKLIETISSCENLGVPVITKDLRESKYRSSQEVTLKIPKRPHIQIRRSFTKPTESRPLGRWSMALEIESQTQQ